MRSLVTDQTERILPQTVTFFVDQTFHTALLFMLDLGELKSYSIVSGCCWLQITVSVL